MPVSGVRGPGRRIGYDGASWDQADLQGLLRAAAGSPCWAGTQQVPCGFLRELTQRELDGGTAGRGAGRAEGRSLGAGRSSGISTSGHGGRGESGPGGGAPDKTRGGRFGGRNAVDPLDPCLFLPVFLCVGSLRAGTPPPGRLWGGLVLPAQNKQSMDLGVGRGLLYCPAVLDKARVFSEPPFPPPLNG